jgi:hypothetical protein
LHLLAGAGAAIEENGHDDRRVRVGW